MKISHKNFIPLCSSKSHAFSYFFGRGEDVEGAESADGGVGVSAADLGEGREFLHRKMGWKVFWQKCLKIGFRGKGDIVDERERDALIFFCVTFGVVPSAREDTKFLRFDEKDAEGKMGMPQVGEETVELWEQIDGAPCFWGARSLGSVSAFGIDPRDPFSSRDRMDDGDVAVCAFEVVRNFLLHGIKASRLNLKNVIADANVGDEARVGNANLMQILVFGEKAFDDQVHALFGKRADAGFPKDVFFGHGFLAQARKPRLLFHRKKLKLVEIGCHQR